ncbi:MAG: hypothetical protein LBH34_00725 [Prevotellaceae bacterium]|jgi:hypothetical protein|nr:hypothetical protein [Prevotellaceae bacterium]
MKTRFLNNRANRLAILLILTMCGLTTNSFAQDDLYFNPQKQKEQQQKELERNIPEIENLLKRTYGYESQQALQREEEEEYTESWGDMDSIEQGYAKIYQLSRDYPQYEETEEYDSYERRLMFDDRTTYVISTRDYCNWNWGWNYCSPYWGWGNTGWYGYYGYGNWGIGWAYPYWSYSYYHPYYPGWGGWYGHYYPHHPHYWHRPSHHRGNFSSNRNHGYERFGSGYRRTGTIAPNGSVNITSGNRGNGVSNNSGRVSYGSSYTRPATNPSERGTSSLNNSGGRVSYSNSQSSRNSTNNNNTNTTRSSYTPSSSTSSGSSSVSSSSSSSSSSRSYGSSSGGRRSSGR